MSTFFVEVVTRSGEVKQRYPVDRLPILIGRAYDNDIILDDPHTAAHHAVVDVNEQGEPVIRDLASHNGIVHRRQRVQTLLLDGHTIVRLGHTSLRLRRQDFQVADELADSTNHHWEGWPPLLVGVILIAVQASFSHWIGQTGKTNLLDYLNEIATVAIGMVIWSGIWALVTHLFSGQMRFGRHLFIAASGLVLSELWGLLSIYLAYGFSLEFFSRFSGYFYTVIIATFLFFHAVTVIPRRRRHFIYMAALLTVGALGLNAISNHQSSGRLAGELYMSDLLPPSVRQSRDQSVDEFMEQVQQMKQALDEAQQEEVDPRDLEEGADPKDQPQTE